MNPLESIIHAFAKFFETEGQPMKPYMNTEATAPTTFAQCITYATNASKSTNTDTAEIGLALLFILNQLNPTNTVKMTITQP